MLCKCTLTSVRVRHHASSGPSLFKLTVSFVEWASDAVSDQVQWSTANTGKSLYHKIRLQNSQNSPGNNDRAKDGTVYYAMSTTMSTIYTCPRCSTVSYVSVSPLCAFLAARLTSIQAQSRIAWQIDIDQNGLNGFQTKGTLTNVQSTTTSPIGSP